MGAHSLKATHCITLLALTLIIGSFLVPSVSAPLNYTDATQAIFEAEAASREAFTALLEADKAGANVFPLTMDFNHGLDLLDQAWLQNNTEGNYTVAYHLARNATETFEQIIPKAHQLREQAIQQAEQRKLTLYIVVPIIVLLSTVTFYLGLKWWRKYSLKRVLEMEIKRGEAK